MLHYITFVAKMKYEMIRMRAHVTQNLPFRNLYLQCLLLLRLEVGEHGLDIPGLEGIGARVMIHRAAHLEICIYNASYFFDLR